MLFLVVGCTYHGNIKDKRKKNKKEGKKENEIKLSVLCLERVRFFIQTYIFDLHITKTQGLNSKTPTKINLKSYHYDFIN